MSAEKDRMRRILGIELAEAGRKAGVTAPMERRPPREDSASEPESLDLLYFSSLDDYLEWFDSQDDRK